MLAQKNRFHSRNAVKAGLFKGSHKSVGPFKVVILPVRKPGDPSVAAVVVSKKTAKTAVSRNLIRRRVFAVLEKAWPDLTKEKAVQIVVVCYQEEVGTMPFDDLERDLLIATHHALKKLS